jgi:polyribonucleotide nucleotidyltransferase
MVKIFGGPEADVQGAIRWVKTLAGQITKGDIYQGKIRKLVDFGMFVELVPGQDGLVHISNIPRDLQRTYMRDFKLDDQVQVEVLDSDEVSGRISLRLITSK